MPVPAARPNPCPRRHQRVVAVVAAAVAALMAAGCSGSGDDTASTSPFKPVIRLAVNDWTASALNVAIAEQLIELRLGYPVEPTRVDDATAMYRDLASGRLDAVLEVWPSAVDEHDQRILDRGQVVRLGPLGPVGQVGWYVPRYAVDDHPELASWESLRDPATAQLVGGVLVGIDDSYREHDEDIIRNLGLPLTVDYSGSEEETAARLERAAATRAPILVYWWVPTAVAATYDLVKVALPPSTEACRAEAVAGGPGVDCDYPPDELFKAASPGLEARAPAVAAFLTAFTLSAEDQQAMLQSVERDGVSIGAAASDWIEANEDTWQAWLPT
ncbi:MAG: glycine betaine ABC transporter substrate-binding protein [Acidimicrobiales bacterium]